MPADPGKIKFNLLGLILGVIVGFGCVQLLEYTDSSFKSEDGLKEFFGYPVLGSISKIATQEDVIKGKQFNKRMMLTIGIGIIALSLTLIILT